jgi:3-oxoacyl-[acyl-carrier-protein] synthase-3
MVYSRISGIGAYLPPTVLTNDDISARVDTNHEWIVERTGIKSRHIASAEESAATMAETAAREAVNEANIDFKDIDFILAATATPDYLFPGVACLLQDKLDTSPCPALDISAACSGFIYGLSIADQYIKNGIAKNVLLVTTEVMSRLVDWDDRRTCILFGDGAAAVVLQAAREPGVLSTHLHADGHYKELLCVPSPLAAQRKQGVEPYVHMQGNEVFRLAVNCLSKSVDEVLMHNKLDSSAIDWLVPHQANLRIIQAIAKKLNMSMEKVILTIAEHGNTSSASIPLAMHTAIRDGRIKRGDNLLLEAFGAGLSWGSALVKY